MPRKLALKHLTASDLTLFKWHLQNRPAGTQKAFNLDARILVDEFYPQLGEPSGVPRPRYALDLYLFGPGPAPANNLQRKIIKQQKNWRLNGELIDNPEDDPQRYNVLAPGDYALFEFSGNVVPETVKVVLVAQGVPGDAVVHAELNRRYPEGSMWLLDEAEVSAILDAAPPPPGHPLYDWIESEAVEDAVLGGTAGIEKINKRRVGRGISPEDFIRSRQAAEQTGIAGEEFLNGYFEQELESGQIEEFGWTSSVNAVSPFDFQVILPGGEKRLIEAKSTIGAFSNPIHLSLSELHRAVQGPEPYDVYRLYEVTDSSAKLRIARGVAQTLQPIVEAFDAIPPGVTVDAISLRPDLLPFAEAEHFLKPTDD